jgi:hypothetical protein
MRVLSEGDGGNTGKQEVGGVTVEANERKLAPRAFISTSTTPPGCVHFAFKLSSCPNPVLRCSTCAVEARLVVGAVIYIRACSGVRRKTRLVSTLTLMTRGWRAR